MRRKFYRGIGAFASLTLGGCGFGLRVPEIQEAWDSPEDAETLVREISKSVYLSVEKAVVCVMTDGKTFVNEASKEAFRKNWAAQMTLQITIQESTTLSPGLSLNTPMHNGVVNFAGEYIGDSTASFAGPLAPFVSGYPSAATFGPAQVAQSYSLGLGGRASSQATRTETSGAFFTVASLVNNAKKNDRFEAERSTCDNQTIDEEARDRLYHNQQSKELSKTAQFLSLITNNDLKIYEWLKSVLHIQNIIAGMGGGTAGASNDGSKSGGVGQNAITHEVQFVVLTDGNVTPTWRLVRVSANESSPLFDTQRQRIHDLIVTFGPRDPQTGALQAEATATHNAALFGLSNVNGLRGVIRP